MQNRVVGNTVGIPSPHTDFNQTDPKKGDYLKNRETLIELIDKKLDAETFNDFVENGGGSGGGGTYDENVLTVDDVTPTLSDDDIYLEGHRTVPNADAVKAYVNGKVGTKVDKKDVVNSGENIVDMNTQIPTVNFMSKEISGSINYVFDTMLIYDIGYYNSDDTFPTSKAVVDFVNSRTRPQTLDEITDTLQVNTEYYLGRVNDIYLSFPTTANVSDVIYVNFETGIEAASLGVDLTNTTTEFDLIPDSDMGYEIFAKYNGRVWILSYSEYSLDGE